MAENNGVPILHPPRFISKYVFVKKPHCIGKLDDGTLRITLRVRLHHNIPRNGSYGNFISDTIRLTFLYPSERAKLYREKGDKSVYAKLHQKDRIEIYCSEREYFAYCCIEDGKKDPPIQIDVFPISTYTSKDRSRGHFKFDLCGD